MAYQQTTWSLADLFPGLNAAEFEAAFDKIEEQVTSFEGVRAKLQPGISSDDFVAAVRASEQLTRLANQLYAFVGLSFAADTQDQAALAAQARVQQFLAETENRVLFFSLWWKQLEQDDAKRLLASSGDYRYHLEALRLFKPHTLTEAEEKIVNLKNVTGSDALITLYDSITNRYVFRLEVEGVMKEMTLGELNAYRHSPDPDLRARSYQQQLAVYAEDAPILGQMYQTRVRDWHTENLSLRKFRDPIAARNLMNDIPDEAVDTLLQLARKNAVIFQRYFKLKARHVGLSKLRRYDLYAPVAPSKKTYPFEQAADMVLESFAAFDPEMERLARRVFDSNHLDSQVRKGKRSGAFAWTVLPELTPWVLMNYQGTAREVATLAHELGHAIHFMLAEKHSAFTYHSSLPLAETASTFGEMMLTDKLLEGETDESVRRDLLFKQVDDAYATIMRQAYFALFEQRAHEMAGKNASVDELSTAYFENLQEQFKDSVELSDDFKWEWISIPHFYHTPFYVYAYAFGQLLVLSLYKQYKAEGAAFKPRYMKLLSAGGSQSPEQILAEAGIDIRSAQFWQGGFDVLAALVEELAKT